MATTKLTRAVQGRICKALTDGATMAGAAAAGGISRDTLYTWLRRGRETGEGEFHDFAGAVELARAASEAVHLRNIAKAGDWRASAWILEKRFPEAYGNRLLLLRGFERMTTEQLDDFISTGLADSARTGGSLLPEQIARQEALRQEQVRAIRSRG